ncbi:uncharacterized protein LOC144359224 [Saccoglossus kowalevskii]
MDKYKVINHLILVSQMVRRFIQLWSPHKHQWDDDSCTRTKGYICQREIEAPTLEPTQEPTEEPTKEPTQEPTEARTQAPPKIQTEAVDGKTEPPTALPTIIPLVNVKPVRNFTEVNKHQDIQFNPSIDEIHKKVDAVNNLNDICVEKPDTSQEAHRAQQQKHSSASESTSSKKIFQTTGPESSQREEVVTSPFHSKNMFNVLQQ